MMITDSILPFTFLTQGRITVKLAVNVPRTENRDLGSPFQLINAPSTERSFASSGGCVACGNVNEMTLAFWHPNSTNFTNLANAETNSLNSLHSLSSRELLQTYPSNIASGATA